MKKIGIVALLLLSVIIGKEVHAQKNNAIVVGIENHIGISVQDLSKMESWYQKSFGMKEIQHLELPQYKVKTVLLRAANGLSVELIAVEGAIRKKNYQNALDAASELGYGHWAITVADVKMAYTDLINKGAKSISAPAPAVQKNAFFAYIKDPEGNLIELMQLPK